jgi:hypothetical protein
MMADKVIPYSIIVKRSSCLDSPCESATCSDTFFNQHVEKLISKGDLSFSENKIIDSYFNALSCKEEANNAFNNALDILEIHSTNQRVDTFCKRILPYVENLNSVSTYLEHSNIPKEYTEVIKEYLTMYNVADRVIKNHRNISKRFNIESEVSKIPYTSLNSVAENCCTMIDTYKLDSYKKLNLCIEEMMYLINKNRYNVNKSDLVRHITEYFLLSNQQLSFKDINNYKLALQENYFLEEADIDSVSFLFSPSKNETHSITESINTFLMTPDKNEDSFRTTQDSNLDYYDPVDIQYNIKRYIKFLWNVFSCGLYLASKMTQNLQDIYTKLSSTVSDDTLNYEDISHSIGRDTIIDICNSVSVAIEEIKADAIERSKLEQAEEFCNIVYEYLINPLNDIKNMAYPKTNLEAIEFVDADDKEKKDVKDFKIFKFHNLIKASINFDNYLKNKCIDMLNNAKDKGKKVLTKVNKVLFNESSSIYKFIGADNKVDITVAQYNFNESDIEKVHEFFGNACKEFNNRLLMEGYETIRSYYIINGSIIEAHIKDCTELVLSESDIKEINEYNDASLDVYIETLCETMVSLECLEEFVNEPIEETLSSYDTSKLDVDRFDAVLEALKFLSVSKDDIELFSEKFSASLFMKNGNDMNFINESAKIKTSFENWSPIAENIPIELQLEAYLAFQAILEDKLDVRKNNDDDDEDDENDDEPKKKKKFDLKKTKGDSDFDKPEKLSDEEKKELKKNPFKGINLNSIRLVLKGIESKIKNLGQKEKEVSKNLDSSVRRLVKGMRDAMISDRREAVIKGSVIPSFSKCLKLAGALAGIAKFVDPGLAVITAIGGFAMSKHLTKKERLLLLDDIEIELHVLDKEISNAESRNQMKKYKALLKQKKTLQREYQRIRYNVKVGKDILPNSSLGVKKYED